MESKKFMGSILAFLFASLMLTMSIYAWITLSQQSHIDQFVVSVNDFRADLILEVKKNSGEYMIIETTNDIDLMFNNAVPNDKFYFKLTIINKSTKPASTSIKINDIVSSNTNQNFDMRDIFYLIDGKIFINQTEFIVNCDDVNPVIIHDQEVNIYRFNNIIDESNDLYLVQNITLDIDEQLLIEFAICYDALTEHINYQLGIFTIGSFLIYLN